MVACHGSTVCDGGTCSPHGRQEEDRGTGKGQGQGTFKDPPSMT
jgi:hypothetical protein